MSRDRTRADETPTRWYHVPVVWVGIVALVGSVLGCVVTVVTAIGHDGRALEDVAPGGTFGLPPLEQQPDDPSG